MSSLLERLIFFPQPMDAAAARQIRAPGVEEIRLSGSSGIHLHGWLVKAQRKRAPLVIYFGGNAEEVSWLIGAASFPGVSLLLMNYRGYGLSGGTPSESALFADSALIFEAMLRRPDVEPTRIGAIGRSIGSAVAVHLAREKPLRAVALITAFDNMTSLGEHHYPFVPVRWLLRHRFDSVARAPFCTQPLLSLVAGRDGIVPPRFARRLFDRWAGPKEWVEFRDAGHNDIHMAPGYWDRLRSFFAAAL
jgi:pimeloyl-ACP methyl ester carboxylesterase